MKARMKFRKYGVMKFIGHLDVMRFFQKAMRRAEIPIAFTSGYSPHMIMSFAQPLGVGFISDGEYMDMELTEQLSSVEAVNRLNRVMVEGIEVESFVEIPDEKKYSGMTVLAAADYLVSPNGKNRGIFPADWEAKAESFMEMPEIRVWKKTKRSEQEADIRPLIYDFHMVKSGVYMKLAAGSAENLKPDLVMQAFFSFAGITDGAWNLQYRRLEMYARAEGRDGLLITLESMGRTVYE